MTKKENKLNKKIKMKNLRLIPKIGIAILLFTVSMFLLTACTEDRPIGTSDMVKIEKDTNQKESREEINENEINKPNKPNGINKHDGINEANITDKNNNQKEEKSFYDRYAEGTITLKELGAAVNSVLKDSYWPNQEMEETEIEEKLGITKDQYKNCYFEYAHLKDNLDQFVLVECKKGEISNIAFALESYRERLIMDHKNQPINYAKANASRIEIINDYVCFVLLGGDLEVVENEEQWVEYCTEQNEKAIDILEKILCN